MDNKHPYELFATAGLLVRQQMFFDAMQQFLEIRHLYPDHELADDGLYNAGLCHFHMNSFEMGIRIFRNVIKLYPDATIYQDGISKEFGRTAAKAHYAIIYCYLGMAQPENANAELSELQKYADSYIETNVGQKITFITLAKKAINTYSQFVVK